MGRKYNPDPKQIAGLPTFQTQRLYKKIVETLEERIRSGVFQPGSYLPAERDLAQYMGVSRTSIREALIALEVKGLVTIRVGDGVQVCDLNTEPLPMATDECGALEQLDARVLIEGEIAALAAKTHSDQQLENIDAVLEEMVRVFDNPELFLQADQKFHLLIAEATGNQVLVEQVRHLWNLRRGNIFPKFIEHYANALDERRAVLDDHRKILAEIRAGNATKARNALRQHLLRVRKAFTA
jgi:DNA-binding FadR family transcriptional regulator